MLRVFSRAAHWVAMQAGHAGAFVAALIIVLVWGATGPLFGYSDTWQLVINTGTTIITFLMVFLLQHSQNRDTIAIQLKLDELIRANERARNRMLMLEDLTDEELKRVKETFASLVEPAKEAVRDVKNDLAETEEVLDEIQHHAKSIKQPAESVDTRPSHVAAG